MPQATALSPQALINAAKASVLAYNEKDWDRVKDLVTSDLIYDEVPTGRKVQGLDAVLPLWQGWAEAFPDSRARFHDSHASGSTVVQEVTWEGTHTGVLQTPNGPIQATGRSMAVRACLVMQMDGERLKQQRHYFDMATLFQQLGLGA